MLFKHKLQYLTAYPRLHGPILYRLYTLNHISLSFILILILNYGLQHSHYRLLNRHLRLSKLLITIIYQYLLKQKHIMLLMNIYFQ